MSARCKTGGGGYDNSFAVSRQLCGIEALGAEEEGIEGKTAPASKNKERNRTFSGL